MLDQSHNVTDPIESLMSSAVEVQRAFVQSALVDRTAGGLPAGERRAAVGPAPQARLPHRRQPDPGDGARARRRRRRPGRSYRASGYRDRVASLRPAKAGASSSGIV
jgi:L-rhamnose isomerase/sugar isomerase